MIVPKERHRSHAYLRQTKGTAEPQGVEESIIGKCLLIYVP
jgi:hypothetical protein